MGVDNKIFQEYIVQTCLFMGCEATGYLLDVLDNVYVNNALTERKKYLTTDLRELPSQNY